MPGTNTFYGSEGDVAVADMRVELQNAYDDWCTNQCSSELTVTIPSTGDIIDSTNGSLVGVWNDGTDIAIPGSISGDRMSLTTQLLVQLKTDAIVSGRRLHGRIFLPGMVRSDGDDGVPGPTLTAYVAGIWDTQLSGDFAVYSPTHHEWATVSSCTVWAQYATLRSRRD